MSNAGRFCTLLLFLYGPWLLRTFVEEHPYRSAITWLIGAGWLLNKYCRNPKYPDVTKNTSNSQSPQVSSEKERHRQTKSRSTQNTRAKD